MSSTSAAIKCNKEKPVTQVLKQQEQDKGSNDDHGVPQTYSTTNIGTGSSESSPIFAVPPGQQPKATTLEGGVITLTTTEGLEQVLCVDLYDGRV